MFVYEKKLQYPVRIKNPNAALAKLISAQYGGPNGELGASLRYLSQRYTMPYPELTAVLNDIGTEELGHLEMVGTIVYQLTRGLTPEEIDKQGFGAFYRPYHGHLPGRCQRYAVFGFGFSRQRRPGGRFDRRPGCRTESAAGI